MLFPNDHARTLVELLRSFDPQGADLMRRWAAALLVVPAPDREEIVRAVESRVAAAYPLAPLGTGPTPTASDGLDRAVFLRSAPVQADGYVEETERAFAAPPKGRASPERPGAATRKSSGGPG